MSSRLWAALVGVLLVVHAAGVKTNERASELGQPVFSSPPMGTRDMAKGLFDIVNKANDPGAFDPKDSAPVSKPYPNSVPMGNDLAFMIKNKQEAAAAAAHPGYRKYVNDQMRRHGKFMKYGDKEPHKKGTPSGVSNEPVAKPTKEDDQPKIDMSGVKVAAQAQEIVNQVLGNNLKGSDTGAQKKSSANGKTTTLQQLHRKNQMRKNFPFGQVNIKVPLVSKRKKRALVKEADAAAKKVIEQKNKKARKKINRASKKEQRKSTASKLNRKLKKRLKQLTKRVKIKVSRLNKKQKKWYKKMKEREFKRKQQKRGRKRKGKRRKAKGRKGKRRKAKGRKRKGRQGKRRKGKRKRSKKKQKRKNKRRQRKQKRKKRKQQRKQKRKKRKQKRKQKRKKRKQKRGKRRKK